MKDELLFTFSLTQNELNIVTASLAKQTFEIVYPVIEKLREQYAVQVSASPEPSAE